MENRNNEHNVYLKDLVFAALHQWKKILIVAVIFAVLLGGFKGITGVTSLNDPDMLAQISQQNKIQKDRYDAEKAALAMQVSHLLTSIQNQQVYLDNSPLMKLDPYSHFEGTAVLYVDSGYKIQPGMTYQNPDPTSSIIAAYDNLLLSSTSLQKMADLIGVDALYLPDLVQLESAQSEDNYNDQMSQNLMIIHVKAATEEDANLILQVVTQQIKSNQKSISESISSHSLSTVEWTVTPKVDPELAEVQQNANMQMDQLMKDLNAVQEKQSLLTLPVYQGETVGAVLKQAVIFAVIGALAGTFLAVAVIWVYHCSTDKVFSIRTLADRTGVKIIGALYDGSAFQKLHIIEGRNITDPQVQAAMLATSIRNRLPENSSLLLTGAVAQEHRQVLIQALTAAIPGLQIISSQDITQSAEALEQLAICDSVVLVEQCMVSNYEGVNRRIELIRDHNKQLLGCVLYGG